MQPVKHKIVATLLYCRKYMSLESFFDSCGVNVSGIGIQTKCKKTHMQLVTGIHSIYLKDCNIPSFIQFKYLLESHV